MCSAPSQNRNQVGETIRHMKCLRIWSRKSSAKVARSDVIQCFRALNNCVHSSKLNNSNGRIFSSQLINDELKQYDGMLRQHAWFFKKDYLSTVSQGSLGALKDDLVDAKQELEQIQGNWKIIRWIRATNYKNQLEKMRKRVEEAVLRSQSEATFKFQLEKGADSLRLLMAAAKGVGSLLGPGG